MLIPSFGRGWPPGTCTPGAGPAVQEGTPPVSKLRRVPYTKPLPPNAEVFTRKGKRLARWVDGKGKRREAEVTDDGQRVRLLSSKWYGEWKDPDGTEHCEPLFTDRTASDQELARRGDQAAPKGGGGTR